LHFGAYTGLRKLKIAQRSRRRFSTGVPVRARRWGAASFRIARVWAACGFLMFWASSNHHAVPGPAPQECLVQARQGERGQDDVVRLAGRREAPLVLVARAALVDQCAELRREALDLLAPVAQHRGRGADQGRGPVGGLLSLREQAGDHLEGLAQAHVVRQAWLPTACDRPDAP